MIGWWIVVSTQSPEERDRADQEARRAATLAMWEDGAEGIRWLEALTEAGEAAKLWQRLPEPLHGSRCRRAATDRSTPTVSQLAPPTRC